MESTPKPLVVVIGSSVASGCYAPHLKGWSWMLGQYLQTLGFNFKNLAMPGKFILNKFQSLTEKIKSILTLLQ